MTDICTVQEVVVAMRCAETNASVQEYGCGIMKNLAFGNGESFAGLQSTAAHSVTCGICGLQRRTRPQFPGLVVSKH